MCHCPRWLWPAAPDGGARRQQLAALAGEPLSPEPQGARLACVGCEKDIASLGLALLPWYRVASRGSWGAPGPQPCVPMGSLSVEPARHQTPLFSVADAGSETNSVPEKQHRAHLSALTTQTVLNLQWTPANPLSIKATSSHGTRLPHRTSQLSVAP